jgi:hypothetical protein
MFRAFSKYPMVIVLCLSQAGYTDSLEGTLNSFSLVHNQGQMEMEKEYEHVFQFVNPFKQDIQFDRIKTSCSCTDAEWPKETIKRGDTISIKVKYNTIKQDYGEYSTQVTLFAKGDADRQVRLQIKGSLPVNSKIRSSLPSIETCFLSR